MDDEQESSGTTLESGPESPPSAVFHGGGGSNPTNSTSSPRPRHSSRRALQKRVVLVPIKDVKGKRGGGAPTSTPSDSWAWRKYGQKPIKGSHYPRGYYRCSSSRSKGCPARKQVERSHEDPSLLIITYFREHNHPCPSDQSLIAADEFCWFGGNMETTSSTITKSPLFAERCSPGDDADRAMVFPMREEEESLFADLDDCRNAPSFSTSSWRETSSVPPGGVGPQAEI